MFGVLRRSPADQLGTAGEADAVVDEEVTGASEFVRLLRDDPDGEFFAGQVWTPSRHRRAAPGVVAAVLFGDLVSIPCQPGPLSHCLIPEQYQIRPPALRPTYTHQRQPGIRQRLVRRPRGDLVSNPHRLITSRRRSRARVPGASSSDDTSTPGAAPSWTGTPGQPDRYRPGGPARAGSGVRRVAR